MKSTTIRILATLCLVGAARPATAGGRAEAPPADARALIEKGHEQIAAGALDEAVRTLTLAREADPNDPDVYNALADAYMKMGAEPMAVVQLEKSLAVDSTRVDTRLRLAEIHWRGRRWNEARRLYQDVLRRDPTNDSAALLLGHLYLMAKQPAGAAHALAGYVERHPGDETAATQYLDALSASGQSAALAAAAESILKSTPDWPPALRAAARARARGGQPEAALASYKRLDALQPLSGVDCFAVGHCYVQLHDDASAATWFTRAMRDSLDEHTDWSEPAAVYMRLEHWPDAAGLYQRALAQDSTAVGAWVNFALCKQQTKDYEAARRALRRAVALRPDHVPSQYALATNYVQMDSTRAARKAYATMMRLAAGHEDEYRTELAQAYRYVSVLDLVEKNWKAALPSLDAALRFTPKDVELRLYRAQALFALNRKAEAKQEFETVLQMQPDNAAAKKGLTLLAQYN